MTEHSLRVRLYKKFGPTKFCSVGQNLEFCQTYVQQNSKVFPQHCDRSASNFCVVCKALLAALCPASVSPVRSHTLFGSCAFLGSHKVSQATHAFLGMMPFWFIFE